MAQQGIYVLLTTRRLKSEDHLSLLVQDQPGSIVRPCNKCILCDNYIYNYIYVVIVIYIVIVINILLIYFILYVYIIICNKNK